MGEKFSMHSPYAYVGNNPMKMIDPTGAEEVDDDNGNTDIAATEATNTAASENPAAANAPCNPCQPGQDPNTPTIPLSKDPVKVNGDKDAGELAGVTIHGEKDKEPASEKVEKAVAPLDKAITTTQVVGLVSKTWSVIKDSPALKALGKLTGSITLVNNGRKALEAYNKGDKAGAAKYGLMTVGQGVAMAVGEEFELTWNVVNLSYEVLQKK
jgi:hypothetical protein